jgi:hypothetical protein
MRETRDDGIEQNFDYHGLAELIHGRFPQPVAACHGALHDYLKERAPDFLAAPSEENRPDGMDAANLAVSTFESLLNYLGSAALSIFWGRYWRLPRADALSATIRKNVREKFKKGRLTDGEWRSLLGEIAGSFSSEDRSNFDAYPQLAGFKPGAKSLRNLKQLNDWRDDKAHGRSFAFAQFYRLLCQELWECKWLAECEVWVPASLDERRGVVRSAYLLNGRGAVGQANELDLHLDFGDLANGCVQVDKTPIVVSSRDRTTYLPLYPFCVFHRDGAGSGLFFVNALDWKGQRLGKITYTAYRQDGARYIAEERDPVAIYLQNMFGVPKEIAELIDYEAVQRQLYNSVKNGIPIENIIRIYTDAQKKYGNEAPSELESWMRFIKSNSGILARQAVLFF